MKWRNPFAPNFLTGADMNELTLMVAETTKEQTHPCGKVTTSTTREIIYDGCEVERGGYTFRVNFPCDEDHEPPWDDGDGQGIVSAVGVTRPKKPGERVLFKDRHHDRTYFDWEGSIQKAKSESWGLSDEEVEKLKGKLGKYPTRGQIVEAAVQRNFEWMRRWVRDEWEYVGIQITLLRDGKEVSSETAWGFDNDDLTSLSTETHWMIDQMLGELREQKALDEKAAQEEEAADMRSAEAVVALRNAIIWSHFSESFKQDLYKALAQLAERAGTPYPPQ